jgi:hypothetical protein
LSLLLLLIVWPHVQAVVGQSAPSDASAVENV